jgi:hypothetical protein
MSGFETGSGELQERMAAAIELLRQVRRLLARGDGIERGRLVAMLEALRSELGAQRATEDRRLRGRLLAVLDEAGALAEELGEEHRRLAAQLRATGVHRRAGVAYRRASRL